MKPRLGTVVAFAVAAAVAAPSAGATSTATPLPTVTLYSGIFKNSAKYTGSGAATVRRRGTVRTLRLARNFRADPRSIRLRMYLATDGTGRTFVDLGPMAESGAQSFRIPAGVKISKYRYAIAWCAAVNEPITQARLNLVRR